MKTFCPHFFAANLFAGSSAEGRGPAKKLAAERWGIVLALATAFIAATSRLALAQAPLPHGISARDMAVAKEEVSAEDLARSVGGAQGDKKEAAAAPALVVQQLARSRERYTTLDAWQQRRVQLREEFLKGAQLWPLPDRTPLNPDRKSVV